jgi:hypothetical protein
MLSVRRRESQQFGESSSASLVDGGANRHLHRLEIQSSGSVAFSENPLELML